MSEPTERDRERARDLGASWRDQSLSIALDHMKNRPSGKLDDEALKEAWLSQFADYFGEALAAAREEGRQEGWEAATRYVEEHHMETGLTLSKRMKRGEHGV